MPKTSRGVAEHRPRRPDHTGRVVRDGVGIVYDVYDSDDRDRPTVLLLPTWSIVDSRIWKLQVPYLARHFRVITFDGRGSGRSDRPVGAPAYADREYASDVVAVLDDSTTDRALLVGLSCGVAWSVQVAASHPDRVSGLIAIGASCGLSVPDPERERFAFNARLDTTAGWAKYNQHYWLNGGYDDFVRFFFDKMLHEPHSTKQIEDVTLWASEVSPQTLADATAGRLGLDGSQPTPLEPLCAQVTCPVLVIHGSHDQVRTAAIGRRLAELTGGELVILEGAGHAPVTREPVQTNHLIKQFADRIWPCTTGRTRTPSRTWTRASHRRKRALYLSSPIGLGHARRDLAIAAELRRRQPELEVEWLAQDPVTRMLARAGETVHPASPWLASESQLVEDECLDHDLHAFQAIRRMDETLLHNFMLFNEVVQETDYDLVIGDEAWEVDHFLHENPELKRFSFAWMTDFVGWLPMPSGGDREAALTADYNAEMLEQRARYRGLRDRSIFVGDPGDVVDLPFGPGLPDIPEWTAANFDFSGYVSGFVPPDEQQCARLRLSLGLESDDLLCVVTVGGSGVGRALLSRVLDAVPAARRLVPDLNFLVVCGPRIDPASLPRPHGVRASGMVPDLHRLLAACDLAVVQGGLTTCMELTATRKPFLYVPLRDHFEQNIHVRHRLERYRAGRCVPYAEASDPERLAELISETVGAEVDYLPVATDGAGRAADLLSALI